MHKRMLWVATFAVAGVLMFSAAPVRAEQGMQDFKVRLGAFFPSKRQVRNATQDVWLHGGLDYYFRQSEMSDSGNTYTLGVSIDYYGSNDMYNIPVMVTYTGNANPQFYYMAGAGVGFAKNMAGNTKTGFAWTVGVGYNFQTGTTPISLEVRYSGTTNTSEQHNGVSVLAGFRF
jgi:hypothetical protein